MMSFRRFVKWKLEECLIQPLVSGIKVIKLIVLSVSYYHHYNEAQCEAYLSADKRPSNSFLFPILSLTIQEA
jgi:hypothetical protein